MTTATTDYQHQANKYLKMAYTLPPNLGGTQDKNYYLAMAQKYAELSRAAGVPPTTQGLSGFETEKITHYLVSPTTTAAGISPTQAVATTTTPKEIKLKKQARAHSYLAVEVQKQHHNNAAVHRAFAIWLSVDRSDRTAFPLGKMLDFVSEKWTSNRRNVRRWFEAGRGIFWDYDTQTNGKKLVRFFGKNSVLSRFQIAKPGLVQLIETKLLTGKLNVLRANLFACVVSKENKWASRKTLEIITGVSVRTQQNYNNLNGQKRQYTYAIGWQNSSGGNVRQMNNRYYRLHFTSASKTNKRRYNLHTLDNNGTKTTSDSGNVTKVRRLIFDNANAAVKAIKKYGQGQVFSVLPETTKRNNLLLKVYSAAA